MMYSTIQNLYNGNLNFQSSTLEKPPLEKYYDKEFERIKSQLEGELDNNGRALLNALLEHSPIASSHSNVDSFIKGFRFATMLTVEVFHDKDNLLESKERFLRQMLHRPFADTQTAQGEV